MEIEDKIKIRRACDFKTFEFQIIGEIVTDVEKQEVVEMLEDLTGEWNNPVNDEIFEVKKIKVKKSG
jgi:hypothetical protein